MTGGRVAAGATAAVIAVAVLAGCGVDRSGNEVLPTLTTSSSAEPTPQVELPPRPRELDLSAVDPCADLLTEEQLRELHYDLGYLRPPISSTSDIHGGASCGFSSVAPPDDRNIRSLVGIATSEGAEVWVTDPARTLDEPPEVVTVEGFPALVLPHPKLPDNCKVVVDTAEGQYLEVSSTRAHGERDTRVEPYCSEAERVAGMAIRTITRSR